jgi:hypothetical protein
MYLHLHLHQSVAKFLGMVWTTIHDMLVQERLQICCIVADLCDRIGLSIQCNYDTGDCFQWFLFLNNLIGQPWLLQCHVPASAPAPKCCQIFGNGLDYNPWHVGAGAVADILHCSWFVY